MKAQFSQKSTLMIFVAKCRARPQFEVHFDNGNQHVGRDSAPDLRLDRVIAVAQELLDSQVLLYPLEDQIDLPAIFVKRRYVQRIASEFERREWRYCIGSI